MSRIPRQAKRDKAEPAIVKALESYGFSVQRLSAKGCPDLALGKDGICRLAEVKSGNQPLRPTQAGWWHTWRGNSLLVLRDIEEVGIVASNWMAPESLMLVQLFRHRAAQVGTRKESAK